MLVDSHCHLDFEDFQGDLEGILKRSEEAGVDTLLTICTQLSKFQQVLAIAEQYPNIYCTAGVHPHSAESEDLINIDQLIKLTDHPKVVGIGEGGLDYHYDYAPKDIQKEQFVRQITAARQTQLPLVIHSRNADEDMIHILENEIGKGAFPFILHCFSSDQKLAEIGVKLGGYVSFSGILTFKKSDDIRQIAKLIPMDRLLVETDAPYLSPQPFRGKRCEPAYVKYTAEVLADIKEVPFKDMAHQTTTNFNTLFTKVIV